MRSPAARVAGAPDVKPRLGSANQLGLGARLRDDLIARALRRQPRAQAAQAARVRGPAARVQARGVLRVALGGLRIGGGRAGCGAVRLQALLRPPPPTRCRAGPGSIEGKVLSLAHKAAPAANTPA